MTFWEMQNDRTENKSLVAEGWVERLTAKRSEGKLFLMMELF